MKPNATALFLASLLAAITCHAPLSAQHRDQAPEAAIAPPAEDPLESRLRFTAREGTWMQPDISPDGLQIVFDLLGDIYAVPISGGDATPVLTGTAFETHPAFSPDGQRIAFVSDRSGTVNLWVADADGGNARQVSRETALNVMAQPVWSADGSHVLVSRMVHSLLGFELWSFPAAGGAGQQLTRAQPAGDDDWSERYNVLGAVADAEGGVFYAAKRGDTFIPKPPSAWRIMRRDASGAEVPVITSEGGAMAPALSPDGQHLAYATREQGDTVLRLRDLASGRDRLLATLDPDGQEGGYYGGVLPRFRFLPDGNALLLSRSGGFEILAIADGTTRRIPFAAPVDLAIRKAPRPDIPVEDGPVRVRLIQHAALDGTGERLAFSALGRLYLERPWQTDGAGPLELRAAGENAYMPAWSPDGQRIAYISWTPADGGAVRTIGADGLHARQLTRSGAFYTEPAFSPDGRLIAALRASHAERLETLTEIAPERPTQIVLINPDTGAERILADLPAARLLRWRPDGRALVFYGPAGLQSIPLDGGEPRVIAQVVAEAPSQYVGAPAPANDVQLSPDGRQLLVRHAAQLRVLPLDPAEHGRVFDLTAMAGARQLTAIGADSARWTADGGILWSVGATVRRLNRAQIESPAAEEDAERHDVAILHDRATPKEVTVLRGARVLTMRGDEVIENGEIVISGRHIAAVGPVGTVAIPPGARVVDVSGRTIIPGLVDAHAHWWQLRRDVQAPDSWPLALGLAFGVTSGLDVQAFTPDIFAYRDRIDSGMMAGTRPFSTGRGYFRNSPHGDDAAVIAVLSRYREHYRTPNIKAYMVGDRQDRRRVARVASSMGMVTTTEGASDLPLGLTHFIDGFAGHEHTLPVSPLREDVVRLIVAARTSYTPTFAALYGGPSITQLFAAREDWRADPRIIHHMPAAAIAAFAEEGERESDPTDISHTAFAADALKVQRAGGLVAMGSHGELHGLGMHWELQAYVEGGATPMEALTAATRGSAEAIGRLGSLGSIEPGKLADLVILTADPREDIRHLRAIEQVIQSGITVMQPGMAQ